MDRSWCWFLDRSGFRKAGIHVFVVLTGGCYRRLRRRRASLGCIFGGTAGSVQRRGHRRRGPAALVPCLSRRHIGTPMEFKSASCIARDTRQGRVEKH